MTRTKIIAHTAGAASLQIRLSLIHRTTYWTIQASHPDLLDALAFHYNRFTMRDLKPEDETIPPDCICLGGLIHGGLLATSKRAASRTFTATCKAFTYANLALQAPQ